MSPPFGRDTSPKTPEEEAARLRAENDYLAGELARLEANTLTPEEAAWVRNRKMEADNQAWAWKRVKQRFPAVALIVSIISGAVGWLLTHSVNITTKP
jgi:hypothetical protein